MKNDLLAVVRQHIEPYKKVLVAYSGGVDSSVLLHSLYQLKNTLLPDLAIRAVYIHHGLSPHATEWAEHCQRRCEQWQIAFQVCYVEIEEKEKNIEAQAREARYRALAAILFPDELLVTAQHLDDQCETFFLALKRGSGPAGLSAMSGRTSFANSQLCRPLLSLSRAEIEHYARLHHITWIEDESNVQTVFDRNFLRLDVLPHLQQRWPHFASMVMRSAQLCAEQETLLDELLQPTMTQVIDEKGRLCISNLVEASDLKIQAVLRRWLDGHGITMPSREQLPLIWHEVALARADAQPIFQLGASSIRRFAQYLYVVPKLEDLRGVVLAWDFSESLILPDNLGCLVVSSVPQGTCIRSPAHHERVTVRFDATGELNIVGRHRSRPIKKLWQEYAVPPWLRHRIPLVFYNEQLIAALGVFTTQQGVAINAHDIPIYLQHYSSP